MLRFTDAQRRTRLAVRHGLHPDHRYPDPVRATRAMTALHATEPATVHLSLHARVDGLDIDGIEAELNSRRTIVKQLAMRRTLFGITPDLLPAVLGSASARVAAAELRRLAADVERAGIAPDGVAWVEQVAAAVLAELGEDGAVETAALRERVPALARRIVFGSGKWAQEAPVAPRVLTVLGARGLVFRGRNAGTWRTSRPRWTPARAWLGTEPSRLEEAEGYAELVRHWLWTFGPGTETDLVWWLGSTRSAARRALADVAAVPVALDSGEVGWVLPGEEEPEPEVSPWAALLPALDPTTMGWKQRDFYLAPGHVPYLFDRAGNAGTTAWWNGHIVGCWVQGPDAAVRVVCRDRPGARARAALEREADRLTAFLGGQVLASVYASPQMRGEKLR
ncbi:winged helix DNA-binding domain-containing protein [Propionicimonas sp.]|uniref:winged helix DNA-binding domain-containing protein n=1 Tax=Propionicimonas sp. TaxID=1955623 RepID=UPI0039E693AB